jgi:hypothetical protein
VTIRYHYIEDSMPRGEIMRAMGAMYDHARQLTDVGSIVADFQLTIEGGAELIRQTATGIRSNVVQTTLLANQLSELAGRLDTVASFLESDQNRDPDDDVTDVTIRQDD